MRYEFRTSGTCSRKVIFDLDGDIVSNVEVVGGCNGNLKGISKLVDGMTVHEIYDKLAGIRCQMKSTSCPDQIARAVKMAYDNRAGEK